MYKLRCDSGELLSIAVAYRYNRVSAAALSIAVVFLYHAGHCISMVQEHGQFFSPSFAAKDLSSAVHKLACCICLCMYLIDQ